jgi:predicted DNA-binding protein (UPF0251 family)
MSGERLSMRKIREVLRLRLDQGLPQRAVAQSLGLSQGAVHGYVARARRAGLSWPLPEGLRITVPFTCSQFSTPPLGSTI